MATTLPSSPERTGVAAPPDPMKTAPWRIVRTVRETRDTFTLRLEPVLDAPPFDAAPGQFNMLYAFGVGEVPISISGPPGPTRQLLHTLRAVGPVTQALQRLTRGDVLGLRGPYGTPWPVTLAEGQDVVMVAGGIGLAPLRPVLYHVLAHRERYGRLVVLFGARTPDDILFAKELEDWRGRFDVEVAVTVDRAYEGWRGHVGVVTSLIARAPFHPEDTTAFVCGPEVMMTFAARDLEHRGVPAARIWVSMERNMKCGVGLCGHCQLGPEFVCKDGPVFRFDHALPLIHVREL
jgi:NAD(P)H-flavin reductase